MKIPFSSSSSAPSGVTGWLWKAASVVVGASSLFQVVSGAQVGDSVCTEGFIMDYYCIDRGTLLDNSRIRTLENPGAHSVHCLVDVGSCVNSPFEVLIEPEVEGDDYSRAFRLTDNSKQDMIQLARQVGTACSTCTGAGTLRRGFRAAMKATIVEIPNNPNIPPIIETSEIVDSTFLEDACSVAFNKSNVVDVTNLTDLVIDGVESNLKQTQYIHGVLMLIGWGFLLPMGVLFAKFFKHRPGSLWFKIHRTCQCVGLTVAIIGWLVALWNFNVFQDKGYNSYRHGVSGSVTMIIGILQPLNAVLRPLHSQESDEDKSQGRVYWEYLHKGLGYSALVLSVVTIGLGTTTLADPDDQTKFQLAYFVGVVGILISVFFAIQYDRKVYEPIPTTEAKVPESATA